MVHEVRAGTTYFGLLLLAGFTLYWGIAARFSKAGLDRLILPNVMLGTATAAYLTSVMVHFSSQTAALCDQAPFSHDFDIARILECPRNAIFLNWLTTLAVIIGLASLVLRIALSRRKDAATS